MTNSYDLVRYPSWPVFNTHLARIGAYAALMGHPFAPFAGCRVLEIGCGDGINLMNMALAAPEAEFVGIDLAEAPIAYGRALAQSAGITNVSLTAQDIMNVSAGIGPFDYIICHGVYAWVPAPVQQAIMALIGATLATNGLAFLSYNADPGCRVRQILRELMLQQLDGVDAPSERINVAHGTLKTFIEVWSDADPFQNALKTEAQNMLTRPHGLLFHDELGAFYAPQRLSDVVDAAHAVGLDYLCDTRGRDIGEMLTMAEPVDTSNWVRLEQSSDFVEMRRFRQSILCRAGDPIYRRFLPDRLSGLWAAAAITPVAPDVQNADGFVFTTPKGDEFEAHDPHLAAFLKRLGDVFPAALSCAEIIDNSLVCEGILNLFARNVIELTTAPLPFTPKPGEYPRASPLARAQIAVGEKIVVALHHKVVRLDDAGARSFITLLDGAHSHAELVREMARETGVTEEEAAARLPLALAEMGRSKLLLA